MRVFITLFSFLLFAHFGICRRQCEPITIPLCKGIGYNSTIYPNSYGHERQEEAGLEVHQFYPLVEVNCYKHLKFFLCAMYTPICQENYDLTVMPCQEVCREAQRLCSPLMHKHGFKWPDTLQCDRLPRFSDQQTTGTLCAAPPDATNVPTTPQLPTISQKPSRDQCQCECMSPFRTVSAEISGYRIQNVSNCAYSCSGLRSSTFSSVDTLSSSIQILAGSCLLLSLSTALTFLVDLSRFPYPERPILFLSLCQSAVAVGILWGNWRQVGCSSGILRSMAAEGIPSMDCLGVFVLSYYFGMSAAVWWMILSLSWVLAAVPHWSTEWIAKYSRLFHCLGWILPGIQTAIAVGMGAVDGDPTTGQCGLGNTNPSHLLLFQIAPLSAYFFVGLLFLLTGIRNLLGIRSNLKKSYPSLDKTSKLTQLVSKIGFFAFISAASIALHIGLLLIEYFHRPQWETALLCRCSNYSPPPDETLLALGMLKTAATLAIGWASIIWIFSPKTLQSWKRFLCCLPSPYATYAGARFTDHIGPQYQQIPMPPPPPPLPHPYPPNFQSPDLIYAPPDLLQSPFPNGTLRHCGQLLPDKL